MFEYLFLQATCAEAIQSQNTASSSNVTIDVHRPTPTPSTSSSAVSVTMAINCDPKSIPTAFAVEQPTVPTNSTPQLIPSSILDSPILTDDPVMHSTSDAPSSVNVNCVTNDPQSEALHTEFIFSLPDFYDGHSVSEYVISVPDDMTASPVVQCVIDGVIASNLSQHVGLQQPSATVLPEEIRPYPIADRAQSMHLKRKSKAKSATLITGSPFKAQLMLVNSGGSLAKRRCKGKNAAANKPSSSSESKPKVQKRNPKVKKNKTRPNSITSCANEAENNDVCANCGFTYGHPNDPLIEDEWLKCSRCSKWCHFSCGTARKMAFECFTCV